MTRLKWLAGAAATVAAIGLTLVATAPLAQAPAGAPAIDGDDIGGVLTGPNGPEAGVWIIAETRDLQTRYIKAVVSDDQGRFVIPDLPSASYQVWARGYGLKDSAKVQARPGASVRLTAVPAASPAEAAKVYPAAYWFSMLKVPAKSEFAKGARPDDLTAANQDVYLTILKNGGCVGCHQIGSAATRNLPPAFHDLGSSEAGWTRRVLSGQAGGDMMARVAVTGPILFRNFGDWTDRIARGELPATTPERPRGIERNVVVTARDWLDNKHYLHDLISTDKRNPTVNANGPLYGATELSTSTMPILDPVTNTTTIYNYPIVPGTPIAAPALVQPSAYWGDETIWDSRSNVHNQMFDEHGRLWMTFATRGPESPAFCKAGSSHPSAKAYPTDGATRHLAMYDPKTKVFTPIDTCFATHHLQFDRNDVLWTSGGGRVMGWFDMKRFDATHDIQASQGWTPNIIDTNGNGKRDAWVEPGQPADPTKDTRMNVGLYAVMPNPVDGSVWGSVYAYPNNYPGQVVRLSPGANLPGAEPLTEVYNVPSPGFGARGADIDSKGVVWVALASGHLASFDRNRCKGPLNGPKATGDQCPEGWTLYRLPGPSFANAPEGSVEAPYYAWVDQHNTLGLGNDVPIVTGNLFDGFHALVNGKFVTLRLPYPLGFYAKGLDGRIDDPKAGWKGRGLWSSSGDRVPWQMEGGKENRPLAVHVQVRPDPLAH